MMFTRDEIIDHIIPYRLGALDTANLAVHLRRSWDRPLPMEICFNGKLTITGNSNAFTNPVLETGIIHCRALLDFLGLKVKKGTPDKLTSRSPKAPSSDDFVIEDFSNEDGPLQIVTPEIAVSQYQGSRSEMEAALAGIIHIANKGLAHTTTGLILNSTEIANLAIATREIKLLIIRHFYTPLGLLPPKPIISEIKCD